MMSNTPRIVICDDDGPRAKQWADEIRAMEKVRDRFVVHAPKGRSEFAHAVEALSERRLRARTGDVAAGTPSGDPAALFDDADILVIDYDLTPYPGGNDEREDDGDMSLRGRTGESVAYLARCYSRCGFIVVVNQAFQARTFDLTLQRFTDSCADLNITSDDLSRRELWLGEVLGSFRPWHWPRLVDMAETFRRRVANVDLGAGVLDSLDFSEEERQALTPRQLDVLGDEPHSVTFEDLAATPEVGLRVKDKQPSPEHRRRIAAGAVGRWLEGLVLPAQNVLIDRPHLKQLYPHLFPAPEVDSSRHSSCDFDRDAHPSLTRRLHQPAEDWLSRYACSHLDAQQAAGDATPLPQTDEFDVFCEDTSRFIPLDQASEVETDVPGPYVQRFVERLPDVNYRPLTRLLRD